MLMDTRGQFHQTLFAKQKVTGAQNSLFTKRQKSLFYKREESPAKIFVKSTSGGKVLHA